MNSRTEQSQVQGGGETKSSVSNKCSGNLRGRWCSLYSVHAPSNCLHIPEHASPSSPLMGKVMPWPGKHHHASLDLSVHNCALGLICYMAGLW